MPIFIPSLRGRDSRGASSNRGRGTEFLLLERQMYPANEVSNEFWSIFYKFVAFSSDFCPLFGRLCLSSLLSRLIGGSSPLKGQGLKSLGGTQPTWGIPLSHDPSCRENPAFWRGPLIFLSGQLSICHSIMSCVAAT